MKLDLDPEFLRTSMAMWRDTVDLKVPMLDEFKLHFMQRRRSILSNFSSTARAWLTVLRSCKAVGSDQDALHELVAEVSAFKDWADSSVQQLDQLGPHESLADQVQDFLNGPEAPA